MNILGQGKNFLNSDNYNRVIILHQIDVRTDSSQEECSARGIISHANDSHRFIKLISNTKYFFQQLLISHSLLHSVSFKLLPLLGCFSRFIRLLLHMFKIFYKVQIQEIGEFAAKLEMIKVSTFIMIGAILHLILAATRYTAVSIPTRHDTVRNAETQ